MTKRYILVIFDETDFYREEWPLLPMTEAEADSQIKWWDGWWNHPRTHKMVKIQYGR